MTLVSCMQPTKFHSDFWSRQKIQLHYAVALIGIKERYQVLFITRTMNLFIPSIMVSKMEIEWLFYTDYING